MLASPGAGGVSFLASNAGSPGSCPADEPSLQPGARCQKGPRVLRNSVCGQSGGGGSHGERVVRVTSLPQFSLPRKPAAAPKAHASAAAAQRRLGRRRGDRALEPEPGGRPLGPGQLGDCRQANIRSSVRGPTEWVARPEALPCARSRAGLGHGLTRRMKQQCLPAACDSQLWERPGGRGSAARHRRPHLKPTRPAQAAPTRQRC